MSKYTFDKNSHYSKPYELGRKLLPRLGDFSYRWEINFSESCWFDKSALGDDSSDWNFKLCGVTGAFSANDANAIMCAGRPLLSQINKWEVIGYVNDKNRDWKPLTEPLIVDVKDSLIVTMSRSGKKVKFDAYLNYGLGVTATWEMPDNAYRFIGPSFGGNRKTPHKMELWVDRDDIKS